MIYVPSDVSVDSLFQSIFEIGKPVELSVDAEKRQMIVRPITEKEAKDREGGRGAKEARKNSYATRYSYFL